MRNYLVWAALLFCCGVFALEAAGVREGMTRAEVEAELGRPLSVMARGDTTILNYPGDGRVELREGKAVRLVRVRRAGDPPSAEELAAAEAARVAAEAQQTAKEEAAEERTRREDAAAEAAWQKSEAEARRKFEDSVERLTSDHEAGAAGAMAGMGLHEEPSHFWTLLGVGSLAQIAVGMVVLKLAFKWSDVHADWGQMFLPALAAVLAGAAVRATGFSLWNVTEFFHTDDALSYAALVFALIKTTHACTWQRAVAVAAAAKLMTIIVWVFLSVALLNLLFG